MTNYVDCGECPCISTGCPEGECLKSKVPELPPPSEFNLSTRGPYTPLDRFLTMEKTEMVFWVYWVLTSYYDATPKEMPLREGIPSPDILKSLELPESIQTVGDFITYAMNLAAEIKKETE